MQFSMTVPQGLDKTVTEPNFGLNTGSGYYAEFQSKNAVGLQEHSILSGETIPQNQSTNDLPHFDIHVRVYWL